VSSLKLAAERAGRFFNRFDDDASKRFAAKANDLANFAKMLVLTNYLWLFCSLSPLWS
jgi:hypothetical protein